MRLYTFNMKGTNKNSLLLRIISLKHSVRLSTWYKSTLNSKETIYFFVHRKWRVTSPGLVVMGDDSWVRGSGFESRRRIL